MRKILKKILLFVIILIGSILVFTIAVVTSSTVQTFVAHRVAQYFSNQLNTEISISKIHLGFFEDIGIEKVYISDLNKDTLAYVDHIGLKIDNFSLKKQTIDVGQVLLQHANFNYMVDTSGSNLNFLINYFSSKDTTSVDSSQFTIKVKSVLLENSNFHYELKPHDHRINQMNYSDLYFKDISGQFDSIQIDSSQIKVKIRKLKFKEQSGIVVQRFGCEASLSDNELKTKHLTLVTQNSHINTDSLVFGFHSLDDFDDFENKVKISANFHHSTVNIADLAYFTSSLKNFRQNVTISGNVKGRINNLKTNNFQVAWGRSSEIILSGRISGLPDLNETFMYIDLKRLYTNKKDIEQLLVFANENDSVQSMELPSIISRFGNMKYKGNITGFYNDLVAYGKFKTSLGQFKTDISLKQDSIGNKIAYKGYLETINFNVGKLLSQSDTVMGNISMKGMVNGYNKGNENRVEMNVEVTSIDVNKYQYHNLSIDGLWDKNAFEGGVIAQDQNLEFTFLGKVDLSAKNTAFDFTADITKAKLYKLHLINSKLFTDLRFQLKSKITGNTLDELLGEIELYNAEFETTDTTYIVDNFNMNVSKSNNLKIVGVQSDVADVDAKLNLNYQQIVPFTTQILSKYYSYIPLGEAEKFEKDNLIKGKVDIKRPELLNYLLDRKVELTANTNFDFAFTGDSLHQIGFTLNAPKLKLMGQKFENVFLNGQQNESNTLHVKMKLKKDYLTEKVAIKDVNFDAWLKSDTADISLVWDFSDTVRYGADLQAQVLFLKQEPYNPKIDVSLVPSYIVLQDTLWYLNDAHLTLDTTKLTISKLILNRESEYIYMDGDYSFQKEDTLKIIVNNFQLSHLNNLLSSSGLNLKGNAFGNTEMITYHDNVNLLGTFNIDELKVNNESYGKITLTSDWNSQEKKIGIEIFTERGNIKPINIYGDYYVETDALDFKIDIQKLLLKPFESLMQGTLNNLKGIAAGSLTLKGTLEKPLLEGMINLQKTSFTVDYLKTTYNLTTPVFVTYDGFKIKNATLNDDIKGKSAVLNAQVTHQFFKNFKYDVRLESDNFLFLHTTEEDNPQFYGNVFAGGDVSISGDMDLVNISANVTTKPKTVFNLSLSSSEEAEENNFVHFVNHSTDTIKLKPKEEEKITGINMDLDINATEETTVKLIFDEKVGDMIKATGNGNIQFSMDRFGEMKMIGEYEISEGNYLFTLQNIINKRFKIEKGGTIKWSGDPYEAYLNVDAVYQLKTSLYDLTLDSLDKKKVPVDCNMKISEKLSDPKINFDISLPNHNNQAEALLASMSQDEVSKQILTLLLLNRFYTPENLRTSDSYQESSQTGALGVNSSELLSNQVSNWLSQISDDFDIGLKYTPGNEISKDELEVALSTQIFNDRLLINGNVSTGGGTVENSSAVAGDISMELKLDKSGKLRLKGYNKSNANDLLLYQDSPYTQGIGFFYSEDFNSIAELTRNYIKKLQQKIAFNKKKQKTQ